NLYVDARPTNGFLTRQLAIRLIQRVHGYFHRQHLLDVVVIQKQHSKSSCWRNTRSRLHHEGPKKHKGQKYFFYTSRSLCGELFLSSRSLDLGIFAPQFCEKSFVHEFLDQAVIEELLR